MPNWVYGSYAIKGKKENILNFLNEGLKNSNEATKSTCREAFDKLVNNAKTKETKNDVFDFSPDKPKEICVMNNLTLDTFRPMPDTFLMWDTTNHSKELKKQSKEQLNKYGFVGWYDYGIYVLRGTKWNAELNGFSLDECDDVATIKFTCDTAWNVPEKWLRWVKETFKVNVLLCCSEEYNSFNLFGEIDKLIDYGDYFSNGDCPKQEDYDNEDDYWDALYEYQEGKKENMICGFDNFVYDFEIDIP